MHVCAPQITPYRAGHVLGAAMFMVEIAGMRCLYTGDYSRVPDRHLPGADTPGVQPDLGEWSMQHAGKLCVRHGAVQESYVCVRTHVLVLRCVQHRRTLHVRVHVCVCARACVICTANRKAVCECVCVCAQVYMNVQVRASV